MKNIAFNIARVIFVLSIPLMLLSASIAIVENSRWFYEYGFRTYNVGQTTGLSDTELDKAAAGLISYFNNGQEYINLTVIKDGQPFTLFNDREVEHLKDVKGLFRLDYGILAGAGIYVLLFALVYAILFKGDYRRKLAGAALAGSGLTLALLAIITVMAVTNFNQFFVDFHLIAFSNDFWLLDPSKDYLIMLFPEGFWSDASLLLGGITLVSAVFLGGLSWWYLRRSGKARLAATGA